ncbi:hypothetical protein LEMLEM_LOCUS1865, partial [Lemmus lemmus]
DYFGGRDEEKLTTKDCLWIERRQTRPIGKMEVYKVDQDVELSATSPAPCLLACCQASHQKDNGIHP